MVLFLLMDLIYYFGNVPKKYITYYHKYSMWPKVSKAMRYVGKIITDGKD